jgi:alanyl-tRNA synthetase
MNEKSIAGLTTDGKLVIKGADIFRMGDQDGFPLWAALDQCSQRGMAVDWIGYLEAARKAGWPDFKTLDRIREALSDSMATDCQPVMERLMAYVAA